ncbi:uncharacterized protein LOC125955368 [Anopheles darlingi]|uniref:uncharacterized protein LOC125955368 n=1 Tax=Anopheles darlingi TaxID=43151 RepID=UPI002100676C|nr:uncharacterized protein LOC125955368 [Anopheles darlingi]
MPGKRKLLTNEKNESCNSRPPKCTKANEHLDAQSITQIRPKLHGIKTSMHGISYQVKLSMYFCLVNAKKPIISSEVDKSFSFTITSEDPKALKFDDIVYTFIDGNQTGILKIQAKHLFDRPDIKANEFLIHRTDKRNRFAIMKYWESFCKQQPQTTHIEGLIICTNSGIATNAMELWSLVDSSVIGATAISLDSCILTLFSKLGGNCYRLIYDKLKDTYQSLFQTMKKKATTLINQQRTKLADLLVKAIKSQEEKITQNNVIAIKYRSAIISIIDNGNNRSSGSYRFTEEFVNPSSLNYPPGYEAFREQFAVQYQKEFKIDGCVWDGLKRKRVHVTENFWSDVDNQCSPSELFPDEDELIKSFCEKFRLWCGTNSENELDNTIEQLLNDYMFDKANSAGWGAAERNVGLATLFKTNFDWLENPFAESLNIEDVKIAIENIKNMIHCIQLKTTSDNLRQAIGVSPYRIRDDRLETSLLYNNLHRTNTLESQTLEVETYDIQFAATLLYDITIKEKLPLFVEGSKLNSNLDKFFNVFHSTDEFSFLIIICYKTDADMIKDLHSKKMLINCTKSQ